MTQSSPLSWSESQSNYRSLSGEAGDGGSMDTQCLCVLYSMLYAMCLACRALHVTSDMRQ
jgi:hypothetical protein